MARVNSFQQRFGSQEHTGLAAAALFQNLSRCPHAGGSGEMGVVTQRAREPFAQQRLGFCHDYMDGHRFLFLQAQPRPRRSERKPLLPLAAALWPTAYAQYIVLLARIYSQKYFNGKKAFTS